MIGRPRYIAAILAAAFTLLTGAGVRAEGLKFYPVDEAAKDPSLTAFRDSLLDAVSRRDVDFVVARTDPDIKLSFGDSYGREKLREWLTEGRSADLDAEAMWEELKTVLSLGGVFTKHGEYCTPYVFCLDVPGCPNCDPFETLFVVSEKAEAYAEPDGSAEVVATLSYDVLPIQENLYPWFKVTLPGGGSGYVTGPSFRMAVDYRAFFEKRDGAWLMTIFIAGD